MTQFIESLARLYKMQKISKQNIDTLLMAKKIKRDEYEYIIAAREE